MAGHWTDKFSFLGAAVFNRDTIIIPLGNDEFSEQKVPYTYYTAWQKGEWADGGADNWDSVSTTVCDFPSRQALFLSPFGQVRLFGGGRIEENIADSATMPENPGLLRDVQSIDGKAYACGMGRQVYRREGLNQWSFISSSIIQKSEQVVGFEAIDGFSEKEIYAVGWDGEIWLNDGKDWKQKESPTRQILVHVCCAGDGQVYICGRNRTLIRGRQDQWQIMDVDMIPDDLWSLYWFDEKLYLASDRQVYYLDHDQLKPVDFGDDSPSTCCYLTSGDGLLLSVGRKDLFCFDGKTWIRID